MLIQAVIAIDETKVGGGAPLFYVQDEQEQDELALLLCRVLGAAAHDLQNGVKIIVKH